jgi:hypothetical protein
MNDQEFDGRVIRVNLANERTQKPKRREGGSFGQRSERY